MLLVYFLVVGTAAAFSPARQLPLPPQLQLGSPRQLPLGPKLQLGSPRRVLPARISMAETQSSGSDTEQSAEYQSAVRNVALTTAAAMVFAAGIAYFQGADQGLDFVAGYIVEDSLSVDNLFVFVALFNFFQVPRKGQEKCLTYGILGAIVLRGVFILLGLVALESFRPLLLVFGSFLLYTSFSALASGGEDDEEEDLADNWVVKTTSKVLDTTTEYDGDRFFTIMDGVRKATPLLLVLVCVEISDVIFAVDSIPAVFGITSDPFIVLTSNLFAILGLRSLYPILSKGLEELEYLESAVALVLGFVGVKLFAEFAGYEIDSILSLAVISTFLGGGIGLSMLVSNDEKDR